MESFTNATVAYFGRTRSGSQSFLKLYRHASPGPRSGREEQLQIFQEGIYARGRPEFRCPLAVGALNLPENSSLTCQHEHSGSLCNLQREIACAQLRNCPSTNSRSTKPNGVGSSPNTCATNRAFGSLRLPLLCRACAIWMVRSRLN
jgi:hypothetical protein